MICGPGSLVYIAMALLQSSVRAFSLSVATLSGSL